ncbi:MAG: ankyrin repeat domain-containing protein [Parachlamydiaceae bacterium]|nr:ankyrin repeat domain-containing protein [Parachlamydiaceae bacterium]
MYRELKLLEELLKVAPELVNLENRDGITPLFWACMYKNKEVVLDMAKLLIENGANVNLPCFYSFAENDLFIEDNATPLCVAAKRENAELVQLLLNHGAIIMRKNEYVNTDEIVDFDEEDRKIFEKVTSENRPYFYGLKKINVDFIISQARSLTEKKALPLVKWGFSEKIPMDILSRVVQIFQHLLRFY